MATADKTDKESLKEPVGEGQKRDRASLVEGDSKEAKRTTAGAMALPTADEAVADVREMEQIEGAKAVPPDRRSKEQKALLKKHGITEE